MRKVRLFYSAVISAAFALIFIGCSNPFYTESETEAIAVTGVTVTPVSTSVPIGGFVQLTAAVSPSDAANRTVAWTSDTRSVATVDSNGKVTALSAGTAKITAKTEDGGKTASSAITVVPSTTPVSGVSLNETTLSLTVGDTEQLTAVVSPADATNTTVAWASNNTAVASVSGTGLINAVSAGTAVITVTTSDGGKTASCAVTVSAATVYYTVKFDKNLTTSDDTDVVTRSSIASGSSITTQDAGTKDGYTFSGWYTASDCSGTAASFPYTVSADVTFYAKWTLTSSVVNVQSVSVTPDTASVNVGSEAPLTAAVLPSNATDKTVTWASDNESVATVAGGVVTGVSAGNATITATTSDGNKTATCAVTVNKVAVTGVSLSKSSLSLSAGGTETLTATVAPSDATDKTVTWKSSDTGIATVSSAGLVSAVAAGSATITVTTTDGNKTATCTVTVTVVLPAAIGEHHPASGTYSPVDVNGDTSGTGWSSASWSLGATVTGSNTTFAVYSSTATKVLLEIYSAAYGVDASYDYWMEKGSDSVWRAEVTGVGAGTIYGFRCWGPNWTYNASWARGDSSAGFASDCDSSGNRFNPNKVLFDPYGKEMTHDQSNATALGTKTTAYLTSGATYRNYDTGKYAPKCYVISDSTSFGTKPAIAAKDAIIYEAHVRGLTNSTSTASLTTILSGYSAFSSVANVPAEYRGTYKGAAYMAPYLKALGINTIELLPVQETDNDANPSDGPGGNFWGYMTFDYFAPDRRYSYDKTAGGPTKEFKEMVKAFHDAGMEVYMDVVYNHTGEGGPWQGSTDSYQQATVVSMRGFDNSTYYCLVSGTPASYWETTGCGNNMQCDNATVRNLIIDSLSYWISTMGVDGFRFDLATVLGRVKNGTSWDYSSSATTLTTIASLGTSTSTEMIAESWDCGSSSYQVGNFPSGWAGWNGRYRDTMRNFIDNGTCNSGISYATGIYGDTASGFSTSCPSINFIVAHDGFTLADLCSYSGKGNALNSTLTWPFGPSDGGNSDTNNLTSISGTDTADRRQRIRNFFTIQMFSAGIPMIVYGDEFGRTQNGNNNPYNIDSVATWNNYAMINSAAPQSVATGGSGTYSNMLGTFGSTGGKNGNFDFARYVMNLRAGDDTLRQITGAASNITYYKNTYTESGYSSDSDRCAGVLISGTNKYYLMINMTGSKVTFTFPAASSGNSWLKLIDTANYAETNCNYWNETDASVVTGSYDVNPFSIVMLKQGIEGGTGTSVRSISLSQTTASLVKNTGSVTLSATVKPTTATNQTVNWSSSNTAVASVSSAGVVTAGSTTGTAVITATALDTTNGTITATCTVTVNATAATVPLSVTADSWTWNGSVLVFAWAWSTDSDGEWIACTGSGSAVNFDIPVAKTKFLLVRCPAGTTTPSWTATGDTAGRIYNKTGDISYVSGTTSYTATFTSYTP